MLSNLADRRTPRVIVPANCQQQLMLRVGQPEVASTLLTPSVEASQLSSESRQPPIVRVGKNHAQQVLATDCRSRPGRPELDRDTILHRWTARQELPICRKWCLGHEWRRPEVRHGGDTAATVMLGLPGFMLLAVSGVKARPRPVVEHRPSDRREHLLGCSPSSCGVCRFATLAWQQHGGIEPSTITGADLDEESNHPRPTSGTRGHLGRPGSSLTIKSHPQRGRSGRCVRRRPLADWTGRALPDALHTVLEHAVSTR